MDKTEEIFDVVDQQDRVIGQAPRSRVHAEGLLHRSVHVLVFNPEGRLFLQKRAMTKDENPGFWDTSSSGHVDSGEGYLAAAHRELMEELGIAAELKEFMVIPACDETFGEHVRCYTCQTVSRITINPEEITEGRFWGMIEIEKALQNETEPFTSTFRLIFAHLLDKRDF